MSRAVGGVALLIPAALISLKWDPLTSEEWEVTFKERFALGYLW